MSGQFTCTRLPAVALLVALSGGSAAAQDWSGWWGGLSVGGARVDNSGSGISDGNTFCVVETTGRGDSWCRMNEDSIETYGRIELQDSFTETEGNLVEGSNSVNVVSEGQPGVSQGFAFSTFQNSVPEFQLAQSTRTSLSSSSGQSTYTSLAYYNIFDFGDPADIVTSATAFGGHLRRDWQMPNNFVFGLEGDFSILGSGSARWTAEDTFTSGATTLNAAQTIEVEAKALGALKLRAGYAIGRVLPYVTGGVALGRFEGHQDKSASTNFFDAVFYSASSSENVTNWATGAVVGAGAAVMLSERVTLSGEALYYAFDEGVTFSDTQHVEADMWTGMLKLSMKLN